MRAGLVAWLVLGLAATACAETAGDASKDAVSITATELASRIEAGDAPFVLDVRSAAEFERGHVPGAVNVPHTELDAKKDLLPKDRDAELVVHCESGRRALTAARWLREQGYTRVRDLEEHMRGWRTAGLPTE